MPPAKKSKKSKKGGGVSRKVNTDQNVSAPTVITSILQYHSHLYPIIRPSPCIPLISISLQLIEWFDIPFVVECTAHTTFGTIAEYIRRRHYRLQTQSLELYRAPPIAANQIIDFTQTLASVGWVASDDVNRPPYIMLYDFVPADTTPHRNIIMREPQWIDDDRKLVGSDERLWGRQNIINASQRKRCDEDVDSEHESDNEENEHNEEADDAHDDTPAESETTQQQPEEPLVVQVGAA